MKRVLLILLLFALTAIPAEGIVPGVTRGAPEAGKAKVAVAHGLPGGDAVEQNQIENTAGTYLNQLALAPEGNLKCGVASVAMVLAMTGKIARSQRAMAEKANALWQSYARPTSVGAVAAMLDDHGLETEVACLGADQAWERMRQQVDAGYPSILLSSRLTQSGHFIVAAGYRSEVAERRALVYDAYGGWDRAEDSYRLNSGAPKSHRGEGVYYDFDAAWGYGSEQCPAGYLLTVNEGSIE